MLDVSNEEIIRLREMWKNISEVYDEKSKRLFVAAMAKSFGHGGLTLSHKITGMSIMSIKMGIDQLNGKVNMEENRQRRSGGGRKKIVEIYPEIKNELEKLIEPDTKGDPESPLRWTSKSTYKLADELTTKGFAISSSTIEDLLKEMGYSLQANKKTIEGKSHPDRDEQFMYIKERVDDFQSSGQPVISVDTKKKELVGNFKNNGKEYRPTGDPVEVNVYDFVDKELGKAVPYGVYDITQKEGWVNVGNSHDTAEFAVESIRRWWNSMGSSIYPDAVKLLITADGGGSNGSRVRLWKTELQRLCKDTGLSITVCHFPPGTSKWNKIEHQLFSYISQNWRGRPLINYETIVNLIASTKTKSGLTVKSVLDTNVYEKGKKISDEEMKKLNMKRHNFHGEWNYTFYPCIDI